MAADTAEGPARPAGVPRDVAAGIFLIAVATFGYFGTWSLPAMDHAAVGPGLMPKGVSLLLGGIGILVTCLGFATLRERIEAVSLRGPIFVLGAVALFAVTVRTMGLAFAGPIAVIVSALADRDSRPMEIIIFAVVMSAFCIVLFKYALQLPIPLAPMRLGYSARAMELFDNIVMGFGAALSLKNLGLCLLGCMIGTLIGVLPGVGPVATISMLLPITFGIDPVGALIMLAGIYYGAQYGGSTTAILVNIPGEATSVVTVLDGHQMARQGRAGVALGIAAIGSFIAGTIATVIIAVLAVPMAKMALLFKPADYFTRWCWS